MHPSLLRSLVGRSALRTIGVLLLILGVACKGENVTGASNLTHTAGGSLAITITGLPPGVAASVSVTGSASYSVTGSQTLSDVSAGNWTITASTVTANNVSYVPQPASQTTSVDNNHTSAATVSYVAQPTTGSVTVSVSGLPNGVPASIVVGSPSGITQVTASTTLTGPAGNWSIDAAPVHANGFTYTASPASTTGTLVGGSTLQFSVQYTLSTGAIAIAISGLPGSSAGIVTITNANGYSHTVGTTQTITDLAPGTYSVAASSISAGTVTYAPAPATQQVVVTASLTAAPASVAYSAQLATLIIGVIGAPSGATNFVNVTGPEGFNRTISGTTTFDDVVPGTYTVTSSSASNASATYAPAPVTTQRTLAAGARDSIGVTWTIATGSIAIVASGLPAGASSAIVVTGPNGYSQPVNGTQTLVKLAPGSYTVTSSQVTNAGTTYVPTPASQNVTVSASQVASPASVAYAAQAPVTGSISVTVTGLPPGVQASASISGNGMPLVPVTSTLTVGNLAPGNYTLTAAAVSNGATTYNPTASSQSINVVGGQTTSATLTYAAVIPAGDDLSLEFAYVTQATQRPDGSVSLVAGRAALLRVFVTNNRANSLTPKVRARIYNGATLLQTATLNAPESSVRTSIAEGTLSSTWNLDIPAANVTTGMRILVDVDPDNEFVESDESNNIWPRNGAAQALSVVSVPAFNVMLVPVTVGALTGNVSEANKEQFVNTLRKIYPLKDVNVSVRLPFTSSFSTMQANGTNWDQVLYEITDLQAVEGPSTTHYYGVVKVNYSSGVAGLGWVGGLRAAIGWDYSPSNDGVAAHEFGHNFNRPHAPCGNPGGPEATYPYAGGLIGMYGWNPTSGAIVQNTATDIMGYCNNQWVSDWTWSHVLTYRQSAGSIASAAAASMTSASGGLLVSGSIVDGRITLRPAFRVETAPTAQSTSATHRVQALDRRGNVIVDLPIVARPLDHANGRDVQGFAVVLPWSPRMERSLATLQVRDVRSPLISAAMTSTTIAAEEIDTVAPALPDPATTVERPRANRMRLRWNQGVYKAAMVRDAATGQVIAFVRESGAEFIARDGRPVDITYSDGVRSVVRKGLR